MQAILLQRGLLGVNCRLPIGCMAVPSLGLSQRIPNICPQKGTRMEPIGSQMATPLAVP